MRKHIDINKATVTDDEQAVELLGLLDGIARRCVQRPTCGKTNNIALSHQEICILMMLGTTGAISMGELARRMVVSFSRLTAITDQLVAKKLVVRTRSKTDRRVVLLELTASGRKRREHSSKLRLQMAQSMLAALVSDEQETFLVLMRKIHAGFGLDKK
jgi:DNA-binding MarR family transcriptional regulator